MLLLSRNCVFRVDPSMSDYSRIFCTCRASTISDLPINLRLSHKRVSPLVCLRQFLWSFHQDFSDSVDCIFVLSLNLWKKWVVGKQVGWGNEEPGWLLSPSVGRTSLFWAATVFLGLCFSWIPSHLYIVRFVKKCLLGKEEGWGREEPRWFLSPSVGRSCGCGCSNPVPYINLHAGQEVLPCKKRLRVRLIRCYICADAAAPRNNGGSLLREWRRIWECQWNGFSGHWKWKAHNIIPQNSHFHHQFPRRLRDEAGKHEGAGGEEELRDWEVDVSASPECRQPRHHQDGSQRTRPGEGWIPEITQLLLPGAARWDRIDHL